MARPSGGGARSSSALRSGCSGAPERDWMGGGAPAGDGDAVCALDRCGRTNLNYTGSSTRVHF
jgi:hypothetical protein